MSAAVVSLRLWGEVTARGHLCALRQASRAGRRCVLATGEHFTPSPAAELAPQRRPPAVTHGSAYGSPSARGDLRWLAEGAAPGGGFSVRERRRRSYEEQHVRTARSEKAAPSTNTERRRDREACLSGKEMCRSQYPSQAIAETPWR